LSSVHGRTNARDHRYGVLDHTNVHARRGLSVGPFIARCILFDSEREETNTCMERQTVHMRTSPPLSYLCACVLPCRSPGRAPRQSLGDRGLYPAIVASSLSRHWRARPCTAARTVLRYLSARHMHYRLCVNRP
jgi:hypothetical protein